VVCSTLLAAPAGVCVDLISGQIEHYEVSDVFSFGQEAFSLQIGSA